MTAFLCTLLTVFLHCAHVTLPQSGQMSRFWRGRAKKPDEHCGNKNFVSIPNYIYCWQRGFSHFCWKNQFLTWTHHLKFGSCINVRSRNFLWNNSCTSVSMIFFNKMSKLEKYSKASSSVDSDALRSGCLQNGHEQSVILRSVIWNHLIFFTIVTMVGFSLVLFDSASFNLILVFKCSHLNGKEIFRTFFTAAVSAFEHRNHFVHWIRVHTELAFLFQQTKGLLDCATFSGGPNWYIFFEFLLNQFGSQQTFCIRTHFAFF